MVDVTRNTKRPFPGTATTGGWFGACTNRAIQEMRALDSDVAFEDSGRLPLLQAADPQLPPSSFGVQLAYMLVKMIVPLRRMPPLLLLVISDW